MHTDDELAEKQRIFLLDNPHRIYAVGEREHRAKFAELYRLARLGLAAEQVGREVLGAAETFEERANTESMPLLKAFLNHEAWRK